MITLWNELDDMFGLMYAALNGSRVPSNQLEHQGLKDIIKRPHNLLTIKSKEDGSIIGHKLEVVTTPFKKQDVHVSVFNDILTVKCGTENHKDTDAEYMVYHGISSQSYEFSLRLSDKIDQSKITAIVEDGILRISLPMKAVEKVKEEARQIEVQ